MPELNWQKSSFSGGPEGECVYLAATPAETILLRESDDPGTILTTTPAQFAALLHHLKRPLRVR